MIGKKSTRLDGIEKSTLPAHCEGATHYVQSALDWKKGVRAYMRGCDGGDAAGCVFAAEKLAVGGNGLTADLPRAIALDSAVCDLPLGTIFRGQACFDASGWIGKKDHAKAKSLMKRACDEKYKSVDDVEACKALKKMK